MFQIVLFDVDGVLLSEKRCFDATTLSVWELLYHPDFLGLPGERFHPAPEETEILRIRRAVFQEDRVLAWLKSGGMNSNWDMVCLLFGFQLQSLLQKLSDKEPRFVKDVLTHPIDRDVLKKVGERVRRWEIRFQPRFEDLIPSLETMAGEKDLLSRVDGLAARWSGVPVRNFSHSSALWEWGRDVYQEWYLGSALYEEVEGKPCRNREKPGFLHQEIPLASPQAIRDTLESLLRRGISLGIGTGRPALETEVPLKALGLYSAFDPNRVVTASDVLKAEESYPDQAPLGKPEPFTYLKAYLGRDRGDAACFSQELPLAEGDRVLIVGDSVADLLAARKMGCRFAATLTGPTGREARAKFEERGADYILEDVTQLGRIFEEGDGH